MKKDSNITPFEDAAVMTDKVPLASVTRYPTPLSPFSLSHEGYLSKEQKIELIEEKMYDVLQILGLDTEDPSLEKTPHRIAKMYVEEIFSGLCPQNFPELSFFENPLSKSDAEQVVYCNNIRVNSFCEHHFVPFSGTAHVAYIPKGKVIGLSKINRIVDYFSKRPQIQERLAAQIADSLSQVLDTTDVAVSITAKHYCVAARGIQDDASTTTTNHLTGAFRDNPSLRSEFISQL